MKLEDIAKQMWLDHELDSCVLDRKAVEVAAPEMLALLLDLPSLDTSRWTKEWLGRRDALIARLRKEIER